MLTIGSFRSLAAFVALSLTSVALAAIGPVTDLNIVNADISPDGFERAAVLAGGTFPGPLITGNTVCGVLAVAQTHGVDCFVAGR